MYFGVIKNILAVLAITQYAKVKQPLSLPKTPFSGRMPRQTIAFLCRSQNCFPLVNLVLLDQEAGLIWSKGIRLSESHLLFPALTYPIFVMSDRRSFLKGMKPGRPTKYARLHKSTGPSPFIGRACMHVKSIPMRIVHDFRQPHIEHHTILRQDDNWQEHPHFHVRALQSCQVWIVT